MKDSPRLRFPDGLRGIAALAVILPHTVGFYVFDHANAFVRAIPGPMDYGRYGVQVFFAVSGFVIAYTLRNANMSARNVASFIFRRSVRLDPPYWAGIALTVAYVAFRVAMTGKGQDQWPTAPQLVAHLFYLQELLGYPEINVAYWTLCIEFQFYLGFAILIALAQAYAARAAIDAKRAVATAGVVAFVVSLPWAASLVTTLPSTILPHLAAFLAGALTWWVIDGSLSAREWWCAAGAFAIAIAVHPAPASVVVFGTMMALYAAAQFGGMSAWLSQRVFQYLGRISYSIYLVHVPIAELLFGLRVRVAPESNVAPFVFHALVVVTSIAVAHVLHVVVEAPCIRLSKRLKQREPESSPVALGASVAAAPIADQDRSS